MRWEGKNTLFFEKKVDTRRKTQKHSMVLLVAWMLIKNIFREERTQRIFLKTSGEKLLGGKLRLESAIILRASWGSRIYENVLAVRNYTWKVLGSISLERSTRICLRQWVRLLNIKKWVIIITSSPAVLWHVFALNVKWHPLCANSCHQYPKSPIVLFFEFASEWKDF